MKEVIVSILCTTYNHELYIRDALDGFLNQKVDFDYEIIIHDDASTDNTPKIIKEYEEKYPNIIHAIYQKENQYSKKGFSMLKDIYIICKGKYIAACEGDDFWIDPHKLQIQVNFLESHSEYIMTAHNAIVFNTSDNTIKAMSPYSCDKEITPEEIILQYNGNIPTASVVVRSNALKMDDIFFECCVGDVPLQFNAITKGKIYYFDRIMSVYRFLHDNSWSMVWLKNSEKEFEHCIQMIDFLQKYDSYTKYIYSKYILSMVQIYAYKILNVYKDKNNFFVKCDQFNSKSRFRYYLILNELKRVFMQNYDENYYDKYVSEFVKKYRHIVIFGAGDYASRMTKQLNNKNINFEGYVVSHLDDENNKYFERPVWSYLTLPYKRNEVGIVVAIKPYMWNKLVDILEENNIEHFICPFLFDHTLENIKRIQ